MGHRALITGLLASLLAISARADAQEFQHTNSPPTQAFSQPTPADDRMTLASLPPGSRVRVTTILDEHRAHTGTVERSTADSLVLTSGRRYGRLDLARVEWSAGHRPARTRAMRGAVVGAAVGGTFGLLIPPQATGNGVGQPRSRLEGLVGYGGIGAVIGLLTGLLVNGEQWKPVDLSPR